MKRCPNCNRIYNDNDFYCLNDNYRLVKLDKENSANSKKSNNSMTHKRENSTFAKNNSNVSWKEIFILWAIVIVAFWLLWSCAGSNNRKCKVCGGTGYYQKKTCVFCDGTGKYDSDKDPYKSYEGLYDDYSNDYLEENNKTDKSDYNTEHTCEVGGCYKNGTYSMIGLSGRTEYYCKEHYREMADMAEKMFAN